MSEINEEKKQYWFSWKERLLPTLEKHITQHFDIYYYPDSYPSIHINYISDTRETAFNKIIHLLSMDFEERITLLLFQDAQTKYDEIGHRGNGFAYDTNMIEIYNEDIKVSPFHELTHVITDNKLGLPPAMFQEGLAMYICELFESNKGNYLDNDAYKMYKAELLFPLNELIRFEEIGSSKSKPEISYTQSGSLIKYMYEYLGKDKFISLYSALIIDSSEKVYEENVSTIQKCYNASISEIEKAWIVYLTNKNAINN